MFTVTENLQMRPMTKKDLPFAMRLHHIEHWNQLEPDWEFLMDADAGGNYVAVYNGKDAGTVTTFTYQDRFCWIGMVLVDPEYRGLGIGSALLNASIAFGKNKGTIRLDATPQGKKLYETLGFKTERTLGRYELKNLKDLPPPAQKCSPVTADVLKEIIGLDSTAFGAERENVLHYLLDTAPQYAYYLEKKGKITGYCFGRPGTAAHQIGPLIAENTADAKTLLLNALQSCPSSVILDVFEENSEWIEELKSLKFEYERPFIRMYLGELKHPGNIEMQYAIAGPEIG
ncbi:MAG TPA: GNAT family N-acetyltransferase [Sphingobacteriaceae bacterium]